MKYILDKDSGIPLYLQLANAMKEDILQREGDEQYYSEVELGEIFEVSRPTIRHAIEVLVDQKYLYKVRGRGTFVYPRRVTPEVNEFVSFSEMFKEGDKIQESIVLSLDIEEANPSVCNKLNLLSQKDVYKIIRLRKYEGTPVIIQTIYLPVHKFPNLNKKMLDTHALYGTMREIYNVSITTIDDVFQATKLNEEEAHILNQELDKPAMLIKRIAESNEVPIEYTVSVVSGDDFSYKVHINVENEE